MTINSSSIKTLAHPKRHLLTKTFWEYFFPILFSIFCSLIILQITSFHRLRHPFNYYGDTIFYSMTIKSVVTTGWYLTNPFIGAPGEHFLGDFPTPDGLNYLIIKILALFTSNCALILNLFFLLGFPLITLSSLFVFRKLSICYPFSFTASLLYAFLPYHLIKGESHLFLSTYYLSPLAIWIALLFYQNKLFPEGKKKKTRLLLYCLLCVLIGSNGVYYAYFSAFFFLLSGSIASFKEGQWKPMKYASSFILIILVSMMANLSSTIAYDYKNRVNHKVLKRDSLETEQYGLKIAQLLLPRDQDRLFSKMKDKYNQHALSVTENTTSSLGMIASFGFLSLIGYLFFRKQQNSSLLNALASLNLGALLLASMGGFSSLLSFFFLPSIRAYNRISIYIAFFSLAAFFLILQKRVKNPKSIWGLSLFLLAFGLYNQSSPIDALDRKHPETNREYKIDRAFVKKIEKVLPPNSLIFQLPYIYFPEGPRDQINSYAHFKPPLHTDKFRWSFGVMRNRKIDKWQRRTGRLPIPEMIEELKRKGFTGLYIDKFGYKDGAASLMNQLSQIIKAPPLFDHHGRSFWDLRELSRAPLNRIKIIETATNLRMQDSNLRPMD